MSSLGSNFDPIPTGMDGGLLVTFGKFGGSLDRSGPDLCILLLLYLDVKRNYVAKVY